MMARISIISGTIVVVRDPESIGPLTNSSITDIVIIWDKIVTIFLGTDA